MENEIAEILDSDGYYITEGLQGCSVCDDALRMARREAKERDEPVFLADDDGNWEVDPDGSVTECHWMDDQPVGDEEEECVQVGRVYR